MPEFTNPFTGMVPRKMTKEELIRAIRLDLTAEEEAVHLYMAHADATDDPLVKKVLIDVANEERVHAGEFQRLLNILAPDEEGLMAEGAAEVDEMQAQISDPIEQQEQDEIEVEAAMETRVGTGVEAEAADGGSPDIAEAAAGTMTIGSLIDSKEQGD